MQLKELFGQRTLVSLLVFHGIILLLCGIAAFFALYGILPVAGWNTILCVVWSLASFAAIRLMIAGGDHTLLKAVIAWLLVYLSMHLFGQLLLERPTGMEQWLDGAIFSLLGGLMALLTKRRKGRRTMRLSARRGSKTVGNIK